jgi:hypothetical protein
LFEEVKVAAVYGEKLWLGMSRTLSLLIFVIESNEQAIDD